MQLVQLTCLIPTYGKPAPCKRHAVLPATKSQAFGSR